MPSGNPGYSAGVVPRRHPVSRSKAILKVGAVGFSVLLAGGLISYRAGAFDWLNRPEPSPVEPESEQAGDPILFHSSKSGAAIPPSTSEPAKTSPLFLSGSKSAMPVVPIQSAQVGPATTPPPANPPIMGGSKSIAPLIPPSPPPSQAANPPK